MRWVLNTKNADFDTIAHRHGISPMTAKILVDRGIETDEAIDHFLNGTKDALYDPRLLKDAEKAVDILYEFAKNDKYIRIIGDYDIDGICSSYILKKGIAFAKRNENKLDVRIPHRVADGYGLNERLIEEAKEDGVDLIITCDNGISAYQQIQLAKDYGITVIVTDHHEVPYEDGDEGRKYIIPNADAVVDPKQEDCDYPFDGICGGVVAYKVMQILVDKVLMESEVAADIDLLRMEAKAYLDDAFVFAAFATVGDVMDLVDENHIIVKYGLDELTTCNNYGMRALIEACDLANKPLAPYHVGFVLGPCFNASGRLDDAYRVVELLCANSKAEADQLAAELRVLNMERQALTAEGEETAYEMVENSSLMDDKVLVVYLPTVHESLAGIIAGRLCRKYYRPVFVLTNGENCVKGSGRSIEGYHMYDEMTKIKDIFLKYGGHKMAAGLSIDESRVDELRQRLNAACTLTETDLEEKLTLDLQVKLGWIGNAFVDEIEKVGPFGHGNEKPLFAERVYVSNVRVMGANRNVIRMQLKNEEDSIATGIYFVDGDEFMRGYTASADKKARIAFVPEYNTYNGNTTIQMKIQYLEWY